MHKPQHFKWKAQVTFSLCNKSHLLCHIDLYQFPYLIVFLLITKGTNVHSILCIKHIIFLLTSVYPEVKNVKKQQWCPTNILNSLIITMILLLSIKQSMQWPPLPITSRSSLNSTRSTEGKKKIEVLFLLIYQLEKRVGNVLSIEMQRQW